MARRDRDDVEVVLPSAFKSLGHMMVSGALAGIGGAMMLGGCWQFLDLFSRPGHTRWEWLMIAGVMLLFILAGAVFLLVGGYLARHEALLIWRRERLLLSAEDLRSVARDGRVVLLIPYDNIEEIRFVEDPREHRGIPDDHVVLDLIDPSREGTILPDEPDFSHDMEQWDVVFKDRYRILPRKLYKKLMKRRRDRDFPQTSNLPSEIDLI